MFSLRDKIKFSPFLQETSSSKKFPWLLIGELTSPHGVKGQLKIKPLSDFGERFTKSGLRWIEINKILHSI